jgi:alpha-mannosidase
MNDIYCIYIRFPHTSFDWIGIDGQSSVLTHFPPADTYNSNASISDILKSTTNHKSKLTSNCSMLLYGHGDGGGGPAVSHLEQLNRYKYCNALPDISIDSHPVELFKHIEHDHTRCREGRIPTPRWCGELYLELHQGTLTSQANIKKLNRECEWIIRVCDVLLSYYMLHLNCNDHNTFILNTFDEYYTTIKELWKLLLLNQFHDVLRKY